MKASIFLTAALIAVVLTGCTDNNTDAELFSEMTTTEITTETPISVTTTEAVTEPASVSRSLLSSTEDIDLRDTDGGGQNYLFDYKSF